MRRAKTHQLFVSKSDTISKAAKPVRSMKEVKWEDWAPTFMNYVRAIPGRDGVPLKYIIRDNDFSNLTPNKDLRDDNVNNSSLQGGSFTIDAAEVHTFIVNLISQNEEAESVIKIHEEERNVIKDWKALIYHYEEMGVYSNNITKTELDLKT